MKETTISKHRSKHETCSYK